MVPTPAEHRILIVDDEEDICNIFKRFLKVEGFCCQTAPSAEEALEQIEHNDFSLMLTDINMPRMSGIDLLREVRHRYPDLAVIMASAVDDRQVAVKALELGALAYVIKPVRRNELVINVINGLKWRFLELEHKKKNEQLEAVVRRRTQKLKDAQVQLASAGEETVLRLAKAAEFRDDETAQHTLRMSYYCKFIAIHLGMDEQQAELIRLAAQLHDVGKIGIPDAILLKPGRLTADEFTLMKEHSSFGFRILAESSTPLLQTGAIIARSHHEKYDGNGYPDGLSGEDIPLEARIAAVADVFDALTSRRVYKDAISLDAAAEILIQGKNNHFDPHLVDIFLAHMQEIVQIREQFPDTDKSQIGRQGLGNGERDNVDYQGSYG